MIEDGDWQKIGYGTYRLKVPGGWFITLYTGGPAKTAFFYSDPGHVWDGNAIKDPPPPPKPAPIAAAPPAPEVPEVSTPVPETPGDEAASGEE